MFMVKLLKDYFQKSKRSQVNSFNYMGIEILSKQNLFHQIIYIQVFLRSTLNKI